MDLPKLVPMHKRIAGIDLGKSCGIAFCDIVPGHPVTAAKIIMGQWDLSLGTYDSGPLRHVRLKQFLSVLSPDLIIFEDVKFDLPNEAMRGMPAGAIVARITPTAEFLGGLKTTIAVWAEDHNVPVHGVAIAQIKAYAVGGRANKEAMIKASNEKFGTKFDPETYEQTGVDNIVDAAFCCAIGVDMYSEGLSSPPKFVAPVLTDDADDVDDADDACDVDDAINPPRSSDSDYEVVPPKEVVDNRRKSKYAK